MATLYQEQEGFATERKRKTVTSYEVKRRYDVKTYKSYAVKLRYDEDSELIAHIEGNKEKGISPADTLRALFQK